MHGFQSSAVRKMAGPQRLADGGLIRSLFGGSTESVTEKYARLDRERAAKQAAAPATAPAPAPAPSVAGSYGAINVLQRREKAAGLKDGGPVKAGIIKGPGTGTSDSIPGTMPAGSFVMPADSTEVLVSNGETNFPPEAVAAVGVAALTAMRDATHAPTPEQEPVGQFADGGLVDDDLARQRRIAQIPTGGAVAPPPDGSQNQITNNELGRNINNATNAVVPGVGAGAVRMLAAADRLAGAGAIATNSPRLGAVAPYLPPLGAAAALASGAGATASAPPSASSVRAAAPTPLPTPAAPPPSAVSTLTNTQASGIPGVQKTVGADGRVLYSDGAGDAALMARGSISAQNMGAAAALSDRSQAESLSRVRAGMNREQEQREIAEAQAINARFGAPQLVSRNQLRVRELAQREREGTARTGIEQGRLANDNRRADIEAGRFGMDSRNSAIEAQLKGTQLQGAQQLQSAQAAVANAKTPEERASAVEVLRTLQGKYEREIPNRFTVVPGGTDDMGNKLASSVINNQTGEFVQQPQAKAAGYPEGTRSVINGKTAIWKGGKWVPQ